MAGLLVHTLVHYNYSLRHLKQIWLCHQLQSLLRILDCCTDTETTDKNRNVSHNHHLLDYGAWSVCMGTNASLSLLFSKTIRAIFLINFFSQLLFLDFFPILAIPLQSFLVFLWSFYSLIFLYLSLKMYHPFHTF